MPACRWWPGPQETPRLAPRISLALRSLPCLRINGHLHSPQTHKLFCGVTGPQPPQSKQALGKIPRPLARNVPVPDVCLTFKPIDGGTRGVHWAVSSGSRSICSPSPSCSLRTGLSTLRSPSYTVTCRAGAVSSWEDPAQVPAQLSLRLPASPWSQCPRLSRGNTALPSRLVRGYLSSFGWHSCPEVGLS